MAPTRFSPSISFSLADSVHAIGAIENLTLTGIGGDQRHRQWAGQRAHRQWRQQHPGRPWWCRYAGWRRGHRYGELCGLERGRQRQPDDRGWAAAAMPKATPSSTSRTSPARRLTTRWKAMRGNNMLVGGAGIDTVSYAHAASRGDGQPCPDRRRRTPSAPAPTRCPALRTSPARRSTTP